MRSGYRITFTYNLLMHADNSRPEGDERTIYDEDEDEDEYDEYLGEASGSEREYDIQELIDSEITLTHWTGRAASAWRRRRCR